MTDRTSVEADTLTKIVVGLPVAMLCVGLTYIVLAWVVAPIGSVAADVLARFTSVVVGLIFGLGVVSMLIDWSRSKKRADAAFHEANYGSKSDYPESGVDPEHDERSS